MNVANNLHNLIRYCTDYINLTNPSLSRRREFTNFLDKYVDLSKIYEEGQELIPISLDTFYNYSPKDLPTELEEQYFKEKNDLEQIQKFWSKFRVSPYTKDLRLQFGFYDIEYPKSILVEDKKDVEKKEDTQLQMDIGEEIVKTEEPLFSIPVNIEERNNKYYLKLADTYLTPQLGIIAKLLENQQNLYFDLIRKVNDMENEGLFESPFNNIVVTMLWNELKAKLKHTNIVFGENSFKSTKLRLTIQSKANYFLSEDLQKLQELVKDNNEDIESTALGSWFINEGLDIENTSANDDFNEIYFPFPTNDSQKEVLRNIDNKAFIVQGPPGTGKSTTIANLATHLAAKNKTVLFVSQKPQAIKVVKDSLKQLDNDLLFGYIPDANSYICTEEDINDGIANKIRGIEQIIDTYHYEFLKKKNSQIINANLASIKQQINDSFNDHKKYFTLSEKLKRLKEFNIEELSKGNFLKEESYNQWEELIKLTQELNQSKAKYQSIGSNNDIPKDLFNSKFQGIEFKEDIYVALANTHTVIKEKLVDRSGLIASVRNWLVKILNLEKMLKPVPKEIYEEVILIITSSDSNRLKITKISYITDFSLHKYLESYIPVLEQRKSNLLKIFNLDEDSFEYLHSLVSKHGFNIVKQKVKEIETIEKEILSLDLKNLNVEKNRIEIAQAKRIDNIKYYLKNILLEKAQISLNTIDNRGLLKQIARAYKKSSKAYKTFDKLKQNPGVFPLLKSIIPIWMMSLEDASRLLPLQKGLFDYVIIDEASQCNIAYTLPVMFRTNRVIFFGDSYQMRDTSIGFKTNRSLEEIARKYKIPQHFQIKTEEESVKSVLDIGELRGFKQAYLRFHYRSPKEIIGFSNEYFYTPNKKPLYVLNSNYLPYKNTGCVLKNHFIIADKTLDTSDKSNMSEVIKIKELIKELRSDLNTANKSIGVLTFFNEQAELLRKEIDDDLIKVATVEGIQGDEKDIIIYSFVITETSQKSKYQPLTGEGGEIRKDIAEGRVNVAFSRARLQVHCVSSLPLADWPDGIWIKKYLEYVEKNGEVKYIQENLVPFDSKFEENFYQYLRGYFDSKEYVIFNQFPSCGFKIDFVLQHRQTGKKIAIECDGPTHFEDKESEDSDYTESDIDRQLILESAGWQFYRLPYYFWERNKELVLKEIESKFIGDPIVYENTISDEKAVKHTQEIDEEKKVDVKEIKILHKSEKETKRITQTANIQATDTAPVFELQINQEEKLVCTAKITDRIYLFYIYVNSTDYTGFTKKGFIIHEDQKNEFIKSLRNFQKNKKQTFFELNTSGTLQLCIQKVSHQIDLRVYINSSKYKGFTKKGFHLNEDTFDKFVSILLSKLL